MPGPPDSITSVCANPRTPSTGTYCKKEPHGGGPQEMRRQHRARHAGSQQEPREKPQALRQRIAHPRLRVSKLSITSTTISSPPITTVSHSEETPISTSPVLRDLDEENPHQRADQAAHATADIGAAQDRGRDRLERDVRADIDLGRCAAGQRTGPPRSRRKGRSAHRPGSFVRSTGMPTSRAECSSQPMATTRWPQGVRRSNSQENR